MEPLSLAGCLDNFRRHGGEVAFARRRGYRTVRWTYHQVAETACQFARELEQRQIGKGDRVLIWGQNCAEWVAGFFGCVLRGAVAVPMDAIATPDFAGRVARQVNARLVLGSRELAQHLAGMPVLLLEDLQAAVAHHSREVYPPVALQLSDPLQIVFTSGTTAEPRGVVITHGNVLANIAPLESEIRKYLKYERFVHPLRFLNLLPLSHVFGQFLGIFLPQIMAGTVLFQESLNPSEVIRTIRQERVSVLVAVPRLLESLKDKMERDLEAAGERERFRREFRDAEGMHFLRRGWRFRKLHRAFGWKFWAFICGGAALPRETEEFWGRLGFAVIQGYGLTETTSLISLNHPFRLGKGSIGKVLAGREVKLAEDGEILVRGAGVAAGYSNGRELRPVADHEGWYRTGDIGALDPGGNLHFKGRKKDVIVTPAGMNVYPEDLEAVLRAQPEVRDCVIVPLAREGNAEPCAVLLLRDPGDAASIVRRANESLAEYQRMRRWFAWPEQDFPRTSTQKPRTNLIREMVEGRLAERAACSPASNPLAELIASVTGRAPADLRPEASLQDDLNLDSLARVAVMGALEDRYQVDLSETGFAAATTVGDLERMLHGEAPPRVRYHYPHWVQRWPVTWIRLSVHYLLLLPAVFLLGWPRIAGRENLRGVRGPVLVVSNHVGDVDAGYILTALPARLRYRLATAAGGEALEALRTPPATRGLVGRLWDRLKWTSGVALLNLFPLPRQSGFRESFAYAGESVDRGYSVLVFPEGQHTTDGKLRPFRAGIGLLATRLNIPVVPMRIDGLFELKQAGKKCAAPGKVQVKMGAPVQFDPKEDPAWIAQELKRRVEEL
jgi:long-chain acyl-CoA synthetase